MLKYISIFYNLLVKKKDIRIFYLHEKKDFDSIKESIKEISDINIEQINKEEKELLLYVKRGVVKNYEAKVKIVGKEVLVKVSLNILQIVYLVSVVFPILMTLFNIDTNYYTLIIFYIVFDLSFSILCLKLLNESFEHFEMYIVKYVNCHSSLPHESFRVVKSKQ